MDISDCISVAIVGVEEYMSSLVSIYPNPSSDIIKLIGIEKLNGYETSEIISITGALVDTKDLRSTVIDISNLDRGIYLFNIPHSKGTETIRFIRD